MADKPLQWQQLAARDTRNGSYGDCEADPVPAFWSQDDDDMYSDSGFIDRFWLPLSVAVLVGWAAITFVLVSAFGWVVILAIAGVVFAGSVAAVALAKTGERGSMEVPVAVHQRESDENRFRNAA